MKETRLKPSGTPADSVCRASMVWACSKTSSTATASTADRIVVRVTGPSTLPTAIAGALAIQFAWRRS